MSDASVKSSAVLERARRKFAPSDLQRQRMHEGILERVAASAATSVPEAAKSGGRLALRANAGKLVTGLLVVLVGSGFAVARSMNHLPSPSETVTTAPIEAPLAAAPARVEAASRPIEPMPVEPMPIEPGAEVSPQSLPDAPPRAAEPTAPRRSPPPPPPRPPETEVAPAKPSAPVDSLGAEMRLVREAQSALKSRDLAGARSALEAHASTYPHGILREERLVLGVLLLCAEGQTERARRAAEDLARAHPRSSHLEPLRGSCAGQATDPSDVRP